MKAGRHGTSGKAPACRWVMTILSLTVQPEPEVSAAGEPQSRANMSTTATRNTATMTSSSSRAPPCEWHFLQDKCSTIVRPAAPQRQYSELALVA